MRLNPNPGISTAHNPLLTNSANPSKKVWCEVPLHDVFEQDVKQGAEQTSRAGFMEIILGGGGGPKYTDLQVSMSERGLKDNKTSAFSAVSELQKQRRSSQIGMALAAGLGVAGLGLLGVQGVHLVNHMMTPNAGSLLHATLGQSLQVAGQLIGGATALLVGKSIFSAKREQAEEASALGGKVERLARASLGSPTPPLGTMQIFDNLPSKLLTPGGT